MEVNKKNIERILKRLPPESAEFAVRDITVLISSLFGETHFVPLKKIFHSDFSIVFWFMREDGNVVFYRSGEEYRIFAEKVGQRYIRDAGFAKRVAQTLKDMTDTIHSFIQQNSKLDDIVRQWDYFSTLCRDFFAYHQATYWPSEYLTKLQENVSPRKKKKIVEIVKKLDEAYKYNEHAVPNIDAYLKKLGIDHLVYTEINENVHKNKKQKSKSRSTLFFDGEMHVLSFDDARKIDTAIRQQQEKYLQNFKDVRGLAVSKGVARGRVRLVIDLRKLGDCEKGDVLVTTQTRPQYNTVIKKVAAIVTDEGGLLCHASMLAREFHIPCVVGTKNATRLLKTGDMVEVDAERGVVKKL